MIPNPPFIGKTVILDTVEYSSPDGEKEEIPLSIFGWGKGILENDTKSIDWNIKAIENEESDNRIQNQQIQPKVSKINTNPIQTEKLDWKGKVPGSSFEPPVDDTPAIQQPVETKPIKAEEPVEVPTYNPRLQEVVANSPEKVDVRDENWHAPNTESKTDLEKKHKESNDVTHEHIQSEQQELKDASKRISTELEKLSTPDIYPHERNVILQLDANIDMKLDKQNEILRRKIDEYKNSNKKSMEWKTKANAVLASPSKQPPVQQHKKTTVNDAIGQLKNSTNTPEQVKQAATAIINGTKQKEAENAQLMSEYNKLPTAKAVTAEEAIGTADQEGYEIPEVKLVGEEETDEVEVGDIDDDANKQAQTEQQAELFDLQEKLERLNAQKVNPNVTPEQRNKFEEAAQTVYKDIEELKEKEKADVDAQNANAEDSVAWKKVISESIADENNSVIKQNNVYGRKLTSIQVKENTGWAQSLIGWFSKGGGTLTPSLQNVGIFTRLTTVLAVDEIGTPELVNNLNEQVNNAAGGELAYNTITGIAAFLEGMFDVELLEPVANICGHVFGAPGALALAEALHNYVESINTEDEEKATAGFWQYYVGTNAPKAPGNKAKAAAVLKGLQQVVNGSGLTNDEDKYIDDLSEEELSKAALELLPKIQEKYGINKGISKAALAKEVLKLIEESKKPSATQLAQARKSPNIPAARAAVAQMFQDEGMTGNILKEALAVYDEAKRKARFDLALDTSKCLEYAEKEAKDFLINEYPKLQNDERIENPKSEIFLQYRDARADALAKIRKVLPGLPRVQFNELFDEFKKDIRWNFRNSGDITSVVQKAQETLDGRIKEVKDGMPVNGGNTNRPGKVTEQGAKPPAKRRLKPLVSSTESGVEPQELVESVEPEKQEEPEEPYIPTISKTTNIAGVPTEKEKAEELAQTVKDLKEEKHRRIDVIESRVKDIKKVLWSLGSLTGDQISQEIGLFNGNINSLLEKGVDFNDAVTKAVDNMRSRIPRLKAKTRIVTGGQTPNRLPGKVVVESPLQLSKTTIKDNLKDLEPEDRKIAVADYQNTYKQSKSEGKDSKQSTIEALNNSLGETVTETILESNKQEAQEAYEHLISEGVNPKTALGRVRKGDALLADWTPKKKARKTVELSEDKKAAPKMVEEATIDNEGAKKALKELKDLKFLKPKERNAELAQYKKDVENHKKIGSNPTIANQRATEQLLVKIAVKNQADDLIKKYSTFIPTAEAPFPTSTSDLSEENNDAWTADIAAVIAKKKPAATLDEGLDNPVVQELLARAKKVGLSVLEVPSYDGTPGIVVGKMENAEQIAELMREYPGQNKEPDENYHRKLGAALGFPKEAIEAFIARDKPNYGNEDEIESNRQSTVAYPSKPLPLPEGEQDRIALQDQADARSISKIIKNDKAILEKYLKKQGAEVTPENIQGATEALDMTIASVHNILDEDIIEHLNDEQTNDLHYLLNRSIAKEVGKGVSIVDAIPNAFYIVTDQLLSGAGENPELETAIGRSVNRLEEILYEKEETPAMALGDDEEDEEDEIAEEKAANVSKVLMGHPNMLYKQLSNAMSAIKQKKTQAKFSGESRKMKAWGQILKALHKFQDKVTKYSDFSIEKAKEYDPGEDTSTILLFLLGDFETFEEQLVKIIDDAKKNQIEASENNDLKQLDHWNSVLELTDSFWQTVYSFNSWKDNIKENIFVPIDARDCDPNHPNWREFISWFGPWELNPKKASKVVDKEGKPEIVAHGTVNGYFNTFDLGEHYNHMLPAVGAGFYFTNNHKVAEIFARRSGDLTGSVIYKAYLNIRKPFDFDLVASKKLVKSFYGAILNILKNWDSLKLKEQTTSFFKQLSKEVQSGTITQGKIWQMVSDYLVSSYLDDVDINNDLLVPLGYDGIKHSNADLEGLPNYEPTQTYDRGFTWIAFKPNQIKSANSNSGEFDPDNPNMDMLAEDLDPKVKLKESLSRASKSNLPDMSDMFWTESHQSMYDREVGSIDIVDMEDSQKKEYKKLLKEVLGSMNSKAIKKLLEQKGKMHFYKNTGQLIKGAAILDESKTVEGWLRDEKRIGGIRFGDGSIHIDGDFQEQHSGKKHLSFEVWSHEIWHNLGSGLDKTPIWIDAYEAEINKEGNPLSSYARKNMREGWAEFGRYINVAQRNGTLSEVEKMFPKCSAVIKKFELWPEEIVNNEANNVGT